MAESFRSLATLLGSERAPGAVVAFGGRGEACFSDFARRVAGLSAAIRTAGPGRWLLFSESPLAAAVSLLALAHAGSRALLAPNGQPETLRELAAGSAGVLFDPGIPLGTAGQPRLSPLEVEPAPAETLAELDADAVVAEFQTSGSSGGRKTASKALRHLDDEIRALEATFGRRFPSGARVFATVSHQHIYGALWRVLWPLAAGRPFSTDTWLHPGELLPRLAAAPSVLVSTPAFLGRVAPATGSPPSPAADRTLGSTTAGERPVCAAVFSSGGPLAPDVARRAGERFGVAPVEVFGSTETGGVGWREPGAEEPFVPLSGVELSLADDERLRVRSPFVAAEPEPASAGISTFVMGDRARLDPDGRFALLGRADRVVKVAEKRLSLPDMEATLVDHDYVAAAALLATNAGSGARVRAVVVPSRSGRSFLDREGRRAMARALGDHIAGGWDRVLVPRAWRYVDALPSDAQGKTTTEALASLFETPPDHVPVEGSDGSAAGAGRSPLAADGRGEVARVREPVVESESRTAQRLVRRARVPADLAYLDGHFDGEPVVAGAVQLRWVMDAARALLGAPLEPRAVEALRFPTALGPGRAFTLSVELLGDAGQEPEALRFELSDTDTVFSSGRCRLGAGVGRRPRPGGAEAHP